MFRINSWQFGVRGLRKALWRSSESDVQLKRLVRHSCRQLQQQRPYGENVTEVQLRCYSNAGMNTTTAEASLNTSTKPSFGNSKSPSSDSPNFSSNNASSPPILDFDNTYSVRSSCDLMKAYSVLKSCSNPLILKHGPKIMELAGPLAIFPTKFTYYKYFVGGSTVESCKEAIDFLQQEGIDVVLDYSVEGLANESQADHLSNELVHSINFAGRINAENNRDICRFGVVKLTGIANTSTLLKLSKMIDFLSSQQVTHRPQSEDARRKLAKQWIPESLYIEDYYLSPEKRPAFNVKDSTPDDMEQFTSEEVEEINRLVKRVRRLCQACVDNKIPLLVDAEHTYYQSAIDYLAMKMHLEFTQKGSFPVIYNTYQLYLKDGKPRMIHDYNFAVHRHGKKFAAKMVRGAYLEHERSRALALGIEDPINETIEATHHAYNTSVEFGIDNIDNMSLFIATHNQETLNLSAQQIVNKYQLPRNHGGIVFGQLYGMGDSLSLALSQAGFNVAKYVPYGPVEEVMPYLSRRVSENGDMFSGTVIETRRIAQELVRRSPFGHR